MPRVRFVRGSRLVTLALLVVAPLAAGRTARAKSAGEWLADGDREYAAARLPEAERAFAAAVQAAPASFPALCRLSQAESELGELQKGDDQRRTRASAADHARAAIKAAPDSVGGHVWLAVALGRQALSEGPKTKLALSREIKSEVDRAIAIDAGNGRAWLVLALWNDKVASLSMIERMAANAVLGGVPKGASHENAEIAFRKAIDLEPGYVNHHLEYGRFLKSRHRDAEARNQLEKASSLPPTSDALDGRYQSEARELLGKMGR